MNKKVLLIADDEEMNRKIISRLLKDEFEIIEAADGRQAIDMIQSMHVDALLLDIIMPEMDGLEVLEAVRKIEEYNRIGILVATSTKEKTERTALSLGADDVVSKPYDPVVIRKRLENILLVKEIQDGNPKQDTAEESTYEEKYNRLKDGVESAKSKIDKYVDIINANKSNFKLVDEIINDIKIEMNTIMNSQNTES